ncbi:uncharacterized protein [Watersipora subatra]|uniref:uncharacterized protein n=1 Tax=Watersipora subatra TaxID=2589382 RepID=UPI00355C0BA3
MPRKRRRNSAHGISLESLYPPMMLHHGVKDVEHSIPLSALYQTAGRATAIPNKTAANVGQGKQKVLPVTTADDSGRVQCSLSELKKPKYTQKISNVFSSALPVSDTPAKAESVPDVSAKASGSTSVTIAATFAPETSAQHLDILNMSQVKPPLTNASAKPSDSFSGFAPVASASYTFLRPSDSVNAFIPITPTISDESAKHPEGLKIPTFALSALNDATKLSNSFSSILQSKLLDNLFRSKPAPESKRESRGSHKPVVYDCLCHYRKVNKGCVVACVVLLDTELMRQTPVAGHLHCNCHQRDPAGQLV